MCLPEGQGDMGGGGGGKEGSWAQPRGSVATRSSGSEHPSGVPTDPSASAHAVE